MSFSQLEIVLPVWYVEIVNCADGTNLSTCSWSSNFYNLSVMKISYMVNNLIWIFTFKIINLISVLNNCMHTEMDYSYWDNSKPGLERIFLCGINTFFIWSFIFWSLAIFFVAIDLKRKPDFIFKYRFNKNYENQVVFSD